MNSALQCIVHCEPLTKYFRNPEFKKELNKSNPAGLNGRLAVAYADLITNLFSDQTEGAIQPAKFKRTLAEFNSEFSGYDQKDSLEFITCLLSGVHEDLNKVQVKPYVERELAFSLNPTQKDLEDWGTVAWKAHQARNDSVIVNLLHGMFKSTTKCGQCHGVVVTFDPFSAVTVPLPLPKM